MRCSDVSESMSSGGAGRELDDGRLQSPPPPPRPVKQIIINLTFLKIGGSSLAFSYLTYGKNCGQIGTLTTWV